MPRYLDWCAQLRTVKSKRSAPIPVCYLEKPEIDALLDAPSPATILGNRDRALLLFMYNSGARADEAAKLCIDDLSLHSGADGTLVFGVSSRQGRQSSHLSALGLHNRDAEKPRRRADRQRTSVPQSSLGAADTLRHP